MSKTNFDAVIFDLDGTLIDSMWVWDQLNLEFLTQRGIELPKDMDKVLEGKSFTEAAIYFKERFKLEMSVEEIKECWNQMAWEAYTKQVPLKKGVKEFLEWLASQKIKIGIASSNSIQLVRAVLKALEIEPYFSEIKTSCEAGRGKPFPDVYLRVAEELGVMPERCLVFEDIPNGILAGKNAGMTAWAIEDGQNDQMKEELIEIADAYIRDYFEAQEKLVCKSS